MTYRKPSVEDQEYKWGDEKHREEPEPKEEEAEIESNENEHEN